MNGSSIIRSAVFQSVGLCVGLLIVGIATVRPARAAVPPVESPITALTIAPDGLRVVACSQAGLAVYRVSDGICERHLDLEMTNPHDVAFSPDGTRIAVGGGEPAAVGTVQVFTWPELEAVQRFAGHDDSVMSLVWLSDRQIATGGLDHGVRVWDVASSQVAFDLRGHSRGVTALAKLDEPFLLISAGLDNSLRVWDAGSGRPMHRLTIHTQPVTALAVRPQREGLPMLASASRDRTIRFWQPTIGRMVRFARLDAVPLAIVWTNDGDRVIAGCENGQIVVVDAATVAVVKTEDRSRRPIHAIAIDSEDRVLTAESLSQTSGAR